MLSLHATQAKGANEKRYEDQTERVVESGAGHHDRQRKNGADRAGHLSARKGICGDDGRYPQRSCKDRARRRRLHVRFVLRFGHYQYRYLLEFIVAGR